jgi:hypothetical protein
LNKTKGCLIANFATVPAVDVLDMLILDITRAAKKTGQKKRLRTLKDLDRAALLLARACSLLLDEQADDAELRETIFNSIPKSRLAESVSKVNELARPQNNNFHDEMVEQYGRVKRFLPAVLRDLHFQAASQRTYAVRYSLSHRTERLETAHPGRCA